MQDRLAALDAEVRDLKKALADAEAEADAATQSVDEWRRWSVIAKSKLASMPPCGTPLAQMAFGGDSESEAARGQLVRPARIV